jgi:hypothetical protein
MREPGTGATRVPTHPEREDVHMLGGGVVVGNQKLKTFMGVGGICVYLRDLRFLLWAGGWEFKTENSKLKTNGVGGRQFRIPNSEF